MYSLNSFLQDLYLVELLPSYFIWVFFLDYDRQYVLHIFSWMAYSHSILSLCSAFPLDISLSHPTHDGPLCLFPSPLHFSGELLVSFLPASLCSDALESRAQGAAGNINSWICSLHFFSYWIESTGQRFIPFYRGVPDNPSFQDGLLSLCQCKRQLDTYTLVLPTCRQKLLFSVHPNKHSL